MCAVRVGARSKVWQYFVISHSDESRATCNICEANVARGGTTARSFSTTNMLTHLKNHHPEKYALCGREERRYSLPSGAISRTIQAVFPSRGPRQACIEESMQAQHVLHASHPRSRQLTQTLCRMICKDLMPYNTVEHAGFREWCQVTVPGFKLPDRKDLSDTLIPNLYIKTKEMIMADMKDIEMVAITTDIWSSCQTESYIGMTAHWVNENYERNNRVLAVQYFPGSHTGKRIAEYLGQQLQDWGLGERVIAIIRDGASNMRLAGNLLQTANFSCSTHILNLIVVNGLKSEPLVEETIGIVRKVCNHFSHSPLASDMLRQIQQQIQTDTTGKIVKTKVDNNTRWNSTLNMLERFLRLKVAIVQYSSEREIPCIRPNHWSLMSEVVKLLSPFKTATDSLSKSDAHLSEVIPTFLAVRARLQAITPASQEANKLRLAILDDLDNRMSKLDKQLYAVTLLDPRVKDRAFSSDKKIVAAHILSGMMKKVKTGRKLLTVDLDDISSSSSEEEGSSQTLSSELPACTGSHLWDSLMLSVEATGTLHGELDTYLRGPLLPHGNEILSFWKANMHVYPTLADVAKQFFSIPPSSVPCERLFSVSGKIANSSRNRLKPENVKRLVFLKNNL